MENKHPIDSTNFSQSSFKKLKKFINARNDEEVIDFARGNGVRVGRWESQQKIKAYTFLTELYNAQIEYDKEQIRMKKEEDKKIKRDHERLQKKEENELTKLITEYLSTGDETTINLNKFKKLDGKDILKTIADMTRGNKLGIIKIGNKYFRIDKINFVESDEMGDRSDSEAANTAIATVDEITLSSIKKSNKYERAIGAFFPYVNNTKIDLTRYGIYNTISPMNYENNCLIHAFLHFGIKNLDHVRRVVKCDDVPKCQLNSIADIIKHQIHVKQYGYDRIDKYGKQYKTIIELGLIEGHYFLIDNYPITNYAIEHYNEIHELDNFQHIKTKEGKYYKRDVNRTTNSFNLIKRFIELGYFREMKPIEISNCQYHNKIEETYEDLTYNEETLKLIEPTDSKQCKRPIIVFDFETNTEGTHTPYLCCSYDGKTMRRFIGEDCALQFLNSLPEKSIIMAHNATYDRCFLMKHLRNISEIARGNHMLSVNATFYNKKITIKDSYNLISMPLKKFGETFKLDTEKEIMPYAIYTHENIQKQYIPINEALKYVDENHVEQFLNNIKKWGCIRTSEPGFHLGGMEPGFHYDIIEYSARYCEMDCLVLYQGYFKFREWTLDLKLDINDILTSASLAHKYFVNTGCYEGVYELTGTPQSFIQKCVVGGRCMVANNEKYKCDKIVNDFDAVSLYPSAMRRMGFLKGKPKVITDWNKQKYSDGYFIEIEIKSIGIKRSFPLMSYMNEDSVRMFSNDMIGKRIKVDKTTLEDMIEFQQVEYDFIKGYYFNDGFNYKIQETIQYLFDTRAKLKREGNPAEQIYKLIMNSGYGKSIMKAIETESHFFNSYDDFEKYWAINHAFIHSGESFGDLHKIKKIKPISQHTNIAHVGASILSMSKRIMNEVMSCAEDNGIQLMYQDTDSIHLPDCDIEKLTTRFEEKYNRKLIGKSLGQFHSDFNVEGCKNVVATKSIFLGKKCYIDQLLGDGQKIDYHIRLKGIPNQVILNYCNKQNITPIELYEQMYDGKPITFDLTDGSLCFEYKNYNVFTKTLFQRTIKF